MENKKEGITSKILTYALAGLLAVAGSSIIKDCHSQRSQKEQQTQYPQRVLNYDECPFQNSEDIPVPKTNNSLEELAKGTLKEGDWFIFEQGEGQNVLIKSSARYLRPAEDGMNRMEMYQPNNSNPPIAGKTDREAREIRIIKIKRQKK